MGKTPKKGLSFAKIGIAPLRKAMEEFGENVKK